jgi:type II secretory pathway pseudopilin PulG
MFRNTIWLPQTGVYTSLTGFRRTLWKSLLRLPIPLPDRLIFQVTEVMLKLDLAKLLAVITGLLVVMLIAVFATLATAAFERQRDAAQIRAIVTVKRDLVQAQEAVRIEGAVLDSALEEKDAANAATLSAIESLHVRAQQAMTHLRDHAQNGPGGNYGEILSSSAAFDRLMPRITSAASLPR